MQLSQRQSVFSEYGYGAGAVHTGRVFGGLHLLPAAAHSLGPRSRTRYIDDRCSAEIWR